MVMTVQSQIYSFLVTVYGGLIIAFIYDIYRVFRQILKPKKVLSSIGDIIFWAVGTIVMLFFMYVSNYVEIRFYSFLGFITGILLYNVLLSRFISDLLLKIYKFAANIILKAIQITVYPIKIILRVLCVPYRFAKRIISLPHAFIKNNLTHFSLFKKKK